MRDSGSLYLEGSGDKELLLCCLGCQRQQEARRALIFSRLDVRKVGRGGVITFCSTSTP